jgi:glucan-binding YG repeat protein
MKKQTKLAVMLASVALLVVSAASIVSARGWVQQGGNWYYQTNDGEFVTEDIQASGNSKFYLGEDGTMQTDYFLEDFGDSSTNTYYFGSNGAMVTNTWVAIDPSIVNNTGDVVPSAYWYYFGATGKAVKANGSNSLKRTTIDGKKYAFNEYGQMLTGWITENGEVINPDDDDPFSTALYYGGDENDGVLHAGWLVYLDGTTVEKHEDKNVLYFYFNPSNNKKTAGTGDDYETKRIDNRMYAFDNYGIMQSGWDAYATDNTVYYSAEDDGHQVKKGWVYAVPDEKINQSNYNDDEEKYMYFLTGGSMVQNKTYKVNGKKYAFSNNGIMQKGIVFYNADGSYFGTVDLDETKGEDVSKLGKFVFKRRDGNTTQGAYPEGADGDGNRPFTEDQFKTMTVEYFGSDGARRTGQNNIEFADDTYTFSTGNNGAHHGINKKKYYSLGVLLKASPDIRYGLYASGSDALTTKAFTDWKANTVNWEVINTTGGQVKGSKTAKKDADGNYWMIDPVSNYVKGIYDVEVKYTSGRLDLAYFDDATEDRSKDANNNYRYWKADSHRYQVTNTDGSTSWKEVNNAWIPFGTAASDGKDETKHEIIPNNDYALNFKFN